MLDRLSLPSLAEAVDGAWSLLDAGAAVVGEACTSVSTLASDAVAGRAVPSFDWMPDTSPLPVLHWLFAPEAPASISAGCAVAAGMSGPAWDHFFPEAKRDWTREIDADGLVRFLRARHPEKTCQHVAARTRLPADTVKKWLQRAALPNGRAVVVLACCYGPELLRAMLRHAPPWLDAGARAAGQARMEARLAALQAQLRGAA